MIINESVIASLYTVACVAITLLRVVLTRCWTFLSSASSSSGLHLPPLVCKLSLAHSNNLLHFHLNTCPFWLMTTNRTVIQPDESFYMWCSKQMLRLVTFFLGGRGKNLPSYRKWCVFCFWFVWIKEKKKRWIVVRNDGWRLKGFIVCGNVSLTIKVSVI